MTAKIMWQFCNATCFSEAHDSLLGAAAHPEHCWFVSLWELALMQPLKYALSDIIGTGSCPVCCFQLAPERLHNVDKEASNAARHLHIPLASNL